MKIEYTTKKDLIKQIEEKGFKPPRSASANRLVPLSS